MKMCSTIRRPFVHLNRRRRRRQRRHFTTTIATPSSSYYDTIVGNTDLIKLRGPSELTGCNIYGKCEFQNPGGSIKDRTAIGIIHDAEKHGLLTRGSSGGIIVEGTAGNTGIGLTLCGNAYGYKTIICIADTQSVEKKDMLRQLGAKLIEVPAVPYSDQNNYVHIASRLATSLKHDNIDVVYANQWDNLSNRNIHYETTGPEIWVQTAGQITAFNCSIGTGGSIAGISMYLRKQNPNIVIGLTDPCGAALVNYYRHGELKSHGSSISEGIGQGRITGNLKKFTPDRTYSITDEESLPILYKLLSEEGLFLGTSSMINVTGSIKMAQDLGPGHTIVTLLCDSGNRYASKLFNVDYLDGLGLPVAPWLLSNNNNNNILDLEKRVKDVMI